MVTMRAIWRGQVIAESGRTLEVGGYRYLPSFELFFPAYE